MSEIFEKLFEKRGAQGLYLNPNAIAWDVSSISLSSDDIDALKDIQNSYLDGQTVDQIVSDIEELNAHELNSDVIGSFMSIFYAEYNADSNPTIEGLGSYVADGVGGAIGFGAGGIGGGILVGACASYLYSIYFPNSI